MHIDETEHKCIKSTEHFTRGDNYHLIPTEVTKDGIKYDWFNYQFGLLFDNDFKQKHFDQIYFIDNWLRTIFK